MSATGQGDSAQIPCCNDLPSPACYVMAKNYYGGQPRVESDGNGKAKANASIICMWTHLIWLPWIRDPMLKTACLRILRDVRVIRTTPSSIILCRSAVPATKVGSLCAFGGLRHLYLQKKAIMAFKGPFTSLRPDQSRHWTQRPDAMEWYGCCALNFLLSRTFFSNVLLSPCFSFLHHLQLNAEGFGEH